MRALSSSTFISEPALMLDLRHAKKKKKKDNHDHSTRFSLGNKVGTRTSLKQEGDNWYLPRLFFKTDSDGWCRNLKHVLGTKAKHSVLHLICSSWFHLCRWKDLHETESTILCEETFAFEWLWFGVCGTDGHGNPPSCSTTALLTVIYVTQ